MPSPVKVVTIIPSFNGGDYLVRAVESLRRSELATQTVVVDNGSTDGSAERVAPLVDRCLALKHNSGFAVAVNQGARCPEALTADYLFVLNQDAEVFPDTLKKLVAVAQAHPHYGILSGLHWANRSGSLDGKFARHLRRRHPWLYLRLKRGGRAGSPVVSVAFINAAAWLVRRSCWEAVGGFNSAYFMYEEDVEFCEKARALGYSVGLVEGAAVLHFRYRPSGAALSASYWRCRSSLQRHLGKGSGAKRAGHLVAWFAYRLALCAWPGEELTGSDLVRAIRDTYRTNVYSQPRRET